LEYVAAFSLKLIKMMTMAMALVLVMVLVFVITVLEILGQIGWLRQHQHQSFHRLRAFY
jgi:hypothetical protein